MDTSETYNDLTKKASLTTPWERIEQVKWYNDPTYIKMCAKAEEIQALDPCKVKVFEEGNWYFLKEEETVRTQDYEDTFFNYIWLPRQDQLQEMVRLEYELAWHLTERFYRWITELATVYLQQSMEQLWLAFVMKEKYNKVWDGEEWK